MARPKKDKRLLAYIDNADDSLDPSKWTEPNIPVQLRGRLSPTRVRVIRTLLASGEYTRDEIGDMFNVTGATISHIATGATWAWLR